jgi:2-methylisocitrate lyase-like PEP mutase family enzyme
LHSQDSPLLFGNVWDVNSALIFQKLGFKAIGTSSAAIAASLGYEDGERMSFEHLLKITKDIQDKIQIPLTVDIEGGYGKHIDMICKNILSLANLGIAGVNIEDSVVNNQREILEAQEFGEKIRKIKKYLSKNDAQIFMNVRTDFYIMGLDNPLEETLKRIKVYEQAGANGVFVPCIVSEKDIKQVVESTNLPVNVMTMPNLPNFNELKKLGIKRISMGPFVYNRLMKTFEDAVSSILQEQSFNCLFR